MYDYALILHPTDPLVSVAVADLEVGLRGLGVMGALLSPPVVPGGVLSDWYAAGPHLLEQVTFLGCSPVVHLAASHDGDSGFCRLRLPPPLPGPIWRAPEDAPPPRCPRCRAPGVAWRSALPAWEANPTTSNWTCPSCAHATPLHQWRLREAAGFGRSFVEFWGIHPGEAVPGDALLDTLATFSGGPWRWFYWTEQRATLNQ